MVLVGNKCDYLYVKGGLESFPMVLVGNKCDEESGKREVSTKTGEALQVNNIYRLHY